jgi:hypothetical protein
MTSAMTQTSIGTLIWRSAAVLAAVLLPLRANAVAAQTAKETAPATQEEQQPAPPYAVDGFRSARFGMTEAEIRKAIAADFKLADKAIAREVNPIEQTAILTIKVPDLLPDAGPAQVSYIFGYTRHQLIYVNVLWAAPKKDNAPNPLLTPATSLRNYFLGYSFRPEGLLRDVAMKDGSVVLFQGIDQKGRAVSLVTGEATDGPAGAERQWVLRLSYVENPAQPDVYRIKPGAF